MQNLLQRSFPFTVKLYDPPFHTLQGSWPEDWDLQLHLLPASLQHQIQALERLQQVPAQRMLAGCAVPNMTTSHILGQPDHLGIRIGTA